MTTLVPAFIVSGACTRADFLNRVASVIPGLATLLFIPAAQGAQSASFSGSRAGASRKVAGMDLCWCPPGRFRMGSPPDEPERRPGEDQVEVTLTKGFWMGKYEVTQGQWKAVIGKLPGEPNCLTRAGPTDSTASKVLVCLSGS